MGSVGPTRAEHAAACDLPDVPLLRKATFDGWRYKHYFEFVERKENNLTVSCTLCPCRKLLSTAANTTSNLTKHLQRQHTHTKLVAKEPWSKMNLTSIVTTYVINYFLQGVII